MYSASFHTTRSSQAALQMLIEVGSESLTFSVAVFIQAFFDKRPSLLK